MAVAAEQYTVHAYTHADGEQRDIKEAERAAVACAKQMPNTLAVVSHSYKEYVKAKDKYVFAIEVIMTQKPY